MAVHLTNEFVFKTTSKKLLALNNNTVTFFRLEMVVKGKIPDRIKQKNKFLKRLSLS